MYKSEIGCKNTTFFQIPQHFSRFSFENKKYKIKMEKGNNLFFLELKDKNQDKPLEEDWGCRPDAMLPFCSYKSKLLTPKTKA